jgi:hypothetical protein
MRALPFGQFPAALKGDTAQAQSRWARISRVAWDRGSWKDALKSEEWASIFADELPIICQNDVRNIYGAGGPDFWISSDEAWHLDLIMECAPTDYGELCKEWRRHLRLVEEVQPTSWWCCGLLQGNLGYLPFLDARAAVRNGADEGICANESMSKKMMASAMVAWLPDMLSIETRLVVASKSRALKKATLASRLGWLLDIAVAHQKVERSEATRLYLAPDSQQIVARLTACFRNHDSV